MHCKGCDAPATTETWTFFDKENKEECQSQVAENLCRSCLHEAREAYHGLFSFSPKQIELACRKMYHKEFATLSDPMAMLIDGQIEHFTIEERYE